MQRLGITFLALCLLVSLAVALPASAQTGQGVSVTCDTGAQFNNGVQVIINQMRSGFNYTATAIGLNGFDPVLAVLDEFGNGRCNDDDATAARYSASLPSTGFVPSSGLSARVDFSQNSGQPFHDVSLVVGGFGNTSGEFLLILEGMAITSADNVGDPFSVIVTPGMVASGVPLTTYMLSTDGTLDPLIYELTLDQQNVRTDVDGNEVYCDDAGNPSLCWGQSASLSGSYVSTNRGQLGGFEYDAMLSLPVSDMQLSSNPAQNAVQMLMTSYEGDTLGQYIIAFHVGMFGTGGPAA